MVTWVDAYWMAVLLTLKLGLANSDSHKTTIYGDFDSDNEDDQSWKRARLALNTRS